MKKTVELKDLEEVVKNSSDLSSEERNTLNGLLIVSSLIEINETLKSINKTLDTISNEVSYIKFRT